MVGPKKTTKPVKASTGRKERVINFLTQDELEAITIYARRTTATLDSTARKVFTSHRIA
ncbi:MAG TPA: hypothetical protein VLQ80_07075 [Candidatus Saccharimonadia bacterium]|nr:hypothetical protein [Candidatus Saccharimonadia bacterium]